MARKIIEPPSQRYRERIHVYGGAGVGKSSVTLNIARYMPDVQFHVIDLDYSFSYERLLATEYADVDEQGNVHVYECEADWDMFADIFDKLITKTPIEDTMGETVEADPRNDWITIDPVTMTWDMVQAWMIDQLTGEDISDYLTKLKAATSDLKEYNAQVSEQMSWPIVNKQYMQKFYKRYHRWRGHSVFVSEAQEVGRQDSDELKSTYGFVGFRPKGQKTIPHVAATNLFFDHPSSKVWRMTSIKDRGHDPIEKIPFEEFAPDYLVEHAGWEMSIQR